MKGMMGVLSVLILLGCGHKRFLPGALGLSSGQQSGAPTRVSELKGTTSMGPTELRIYQGQVDPRHVIGKVGNLNEWVLQNKIASESGGGPHQIESSMEVPHEAPLYLVSMTDGLLSLAAFVDNEFAGHLRKPTISYQGFEYKPVVKYCSRYHFKGNDFLSHPVNCSTNLGIPCLAPRVTDLSCRLLGEGDLACQGLPILGIPLDVTQFTVAGGKFIQAESQAFECLKREEGYLSPFHLFESTVLKAVRLHFNSSESFQVSIEPPHLDGTPGVKKEVRFTELFVDFNLDKLKPE